MKICYIFSGFYQAKIIGQSAVALRLIDNIRNKGHKVYMISNYLMESGHFYINGENQLLLKGPNTLGTYLKNTHKILEYLKMVKPDILHVRGLLMVIYVWVLNKLFLQYPLVISIFETPEHLKSFYRRLISFCINRAEVTFVSSRFIKDKFIKNGARSEKIRVRYTGLKEKFLRITETQLSADTDVIFFGDSIKERGFDIIYHLARKLPGFRFKVLIRWQGENCRNELERMKKMKNITIWHYPYAESLEKILLRTKLIVLPYRYMGMRPPISLLESMVLGKCVITSDMKGNEEFIKHGKNGFIYDFSDLDEVCKKIIFLLNNDDIRNRIGKEARKTIKNQYSKNEYDKIFYYYSYIKENFYEKGMFGDVGGKYISEREINTVLRLLDPEGRDRILDVGTGSGRFARAIVKASKARVVGLDPDKTILKEGEKLNDIFLSEEEIDRYDCILGDGHNIPYKNNKFDKVICVRVLKYYKDSWRGIDELIRVLKHRGTLVLEITSNRSWESFVNPIVMRLSKKRVVSHFWEKNMRNFNLKKVREYLVKHGMIILEERPLHKLPPGLYTQFNSTLVNDLFNSIEKILLRITPLTFLSKSVIFKCQKMN